MFSLHIHNKERSWLVFSGLVVEQKLRIGTHFGPTGFPVHFLWFRSSLLELLNGMEEATQKLYQYSVKEFKAVAGSLILMWWCIKPRETNDEETQAMRQWINWNGWAIQ